MNEINLRNLEATDIAPMASILSKIGIKEFKNCIPKDAKGNIEEIGVAVAFEIAGVVLANYSKCQEDIFKFFASLTEKTTEEISKMSLVEFTKLVVFFFKKEEFKDFYKVVSEFL